MRRKLDSKFYLSVIEGNYSELLEMFKDEPEELRESMALNHSFDMLEDLGDKSIVPELLKYIDGEINRYDYKKSGALTVLGTLGDKSHESIIEQYLNSENYFLSFTSLSSMCRLQERGELSKDKSDQLTSRLIKTLSELDCSVEVAVECARALTFSKYQGLNELLEKAKSKVPEFSDDYRDSIIY